MEILRLDNVTKTYGTSRAQVQAVNRVSLSVSKGSFTSIIGRSGSGKSTLLKLCSGLLKPDSGRVILDGDEISNMRDKECCAVRRRKIGFIFRNFELIPEFTVLENICLPSYLDERSPNMNYIEKLLKDTELQQKRDAFPDELSGGEQQRVAIARALSTRPAILFADEPTGNLDIKSGEIIMELLNFCNFRYGQTILMVTHNLELLQYTQRTLRMQDGGIVEERDKGEENP